VGLRQRDEPVERLDPDRSAPLFVEHAQQLQARARKCDERLRVGPDVRLGGEEGGRTAGSTRGEAVAFDQDEAGAGTKSVGREPDDAAADDEHVGAAVKFWWDAGSRAASTPAPAVSRQTASATDTPRGYAGARWPRPSSRRHVGRRQLRARACRLHPEAAPR
jgi:hypothetical protein